MGFITIHKEKQPCHCGLPSSGFNKGDVIQCEGCQEYWRCRGKSDGGMQWDPSPRVLLWERVRKLYNERNQKTVWETF